MQIPIESKFDDNLKAIARLGGYLRGKQENVVELVRSLARGERYPAECEPLAFEAIGWIMPQIEDRQPFHLYYRDSAGKVEVWPICYGVLVFRDRHLYLDAWTGTPRPNILNLSNNTTFRLDRVLGVQSAPDLEWRDSGLETAIVAIALYGRLVDAYERKPEDADLEYQGDRLIVARRVTSDFWLVRQLLAYGADCEVLSPEPFRQAMGDRLKEAADRYLEARL